MSGRVGWSETYPKGNDDRTRLSIGCLRPRGRRARVTRDPCTVRPTAQQGPRLVPWPLRYSDSLYDEGREFRPMLSPDQPSGGQCEQRLRRIEVSVGGLWVRASSDSTSADRAAVGGVTGGVTGGSSQG